MWASGLRGGVAFAIASKSFHHLDFGERCGGLTRDAADATETCADVNDGAAVLQITMIIVLFTIFVFGGSMTTIARQCDVCSDHTVHRGSLKEPFMKQGRNGGPKAGSALDMWRWASHELLLGVLTHHGREKESKDDLRFAPAMLTTKSERRASITALQMAPAEMPKSRRSTIHVPSEPVAPPMPRRRRKSLADARAVVMPPPSEG